MCGNIREMHPYYCDEKCGSNLIVVDVSSQNPNVFYEFGMAVSLEKLIMPVCFSESFYKLEISGEIINVLKDFRGLEAFYKVKVTHCNAENNSIPYEFTPDNQRDNRTVTSIEMMGDEIIYFILSSL